MSESFFVKVLGGGAVALCSYLFGGLDSTLTTLIMFIIVDFVTGTLVAVKRKSLSKAKSFDGFTKKIVTLLMVAVAVRVDVMMGGNGAIRLVALYGYIGTEFYSIVENAIHLGVPIPEQLGKYFEAYADMTGVHKRRSTDNEQ